MLIYFNLSVIERGSSALESLFIRKWTFYFRVVRRTRSFRDAWYAWSGNYYWNASLPYVSPRDELRRSSVSQDVYAAGTSSTRDQVLPTVAALSSGLRRTGHKGYGSPLLGCVCICWKQLVLLRWPENSESEKASASTPQQDPFAQRRLRIKAQRTDSVTRSGVDCS